MPHLHLTCSSNIKEKMDPEKIFGPCHQILAETIKANIANCQSTVVIHPHFYVGKGGSKEAFIHMKVTIKQGRTEEMIQLAKKQIMEVLKRYFSESLKTLKVQMSVYIIEFPGTHYEKVESNT